MVSKNAEGALFPVGEVGEYPLGMLKDAIVETGEVAGIDDDIRRQVFNFSEGLEKVFITDPGADVQVADLHQPAAGPGRVKAGKHQLVFTDGEPMRFVASPGKGGQAASPCGQGGLGEERSAAQWM